MPSHARSDAGTKGHIPWGQASTKHTFSYTTVVTALVKTCTLSLSLGRTHTRPTSHTKGTHTPSSSLAPINPFSGRACAQTLAQIRKMGFASHNKPWIAPCTAHGASSLYALAFLVTRVPSKGTLYSKTVSSSCGTKWHRFAAGTHIAAQAISLNFKGSGCGVGHNGFGFKMAGGAQRRRGPRRGRTPCPRPHPHRRLRRPWNRPRRPCREGCSCWGASADGGP